MTKERWAGALAVCAAAVRLIPLHFLHPLNWDELEFWRATRWIAEGRLPYRDFWEHHTPLPWLVFAPFTLLTNSAGVDAVILLRWLQVPLWIAAFWMLNAWMRGAGIERFARWSAMALALSSSLFMIPAVEYRVETLGCALFIAGLLLIQREHPFWAGVVFCLCGFANLRFAPVIVVAVLIGMRGRRQKAEGRSERRGFCLLPSGFCLPIGGLITLIVILGAAAATHTLVPMIQQVWQDNRAERYAVAIVGGFVHRLLVPFGVRVMASDRLFELAAVDVGGIAILVLGVIGMIIAIVRRSRVLPIAVLLAVNLAFIASMKFVYNYHFELVVLLMVPLVAALIGERRAVLALIVLAFCVSAFASIFRGKELDLAYQNRIMTEVDARTRPGERVFSGITWALHRQPAYRFWFLPELARMLVLHGEAPRYEMRVPPDAIVFDHNALVWIATVQRELAPYFVRHYIPLWRELWIPAMNARVRAGQAVQWIVPRDGNYRVYASPELAKHAWFHDPLSYPARTIELHPQTVPLQFDADLAHLRRGQRLTALNPTANDLGVILLPTDDRVLFRQPPPGATLEAETTRVTHVPDLLARFR